MESLSQFALLRSKRFGPFFWTQFIGAFNDNVFKNSLIILITFQTVKLSNDATNFLINLCMGLFILPFFLFSATAGQLADKYEKASLIRYIKLLEIAIMSIASVGFYFNSINFLLLVLFLLGIQASFFGPVKYSILPTHLATYELMAGNGLVESGTFIAIIMGTLLGGLLISIPTYGWVSVSIALLFFAILGWLTSLAIPKTSSSTTTLKINWNFFKENCHILAYTHKNKPIFLAIIAISWFWFYGSVIFAQLPTFTKIYLGGNEFVVTLLLILFSVGIGVGALMCNKLSHHKIEIGLVPLGSLGLSLFAIILYIICHTPHSGPTLSVIDFLSIPYHWLILINITGLSLCAGLYIVPLYAFIQNQGDKTYLSRIISANNILNALFMVLAALFAILLLKVGINVVQLILITGLVNGCVAIFIFLQMPDFLQRFFVWLYAYKRNGNK